MSPTVRAARPEDAAAIAAIYSEGIADRIATFETEARTTEDVLAWFQSGHPIVVVEALGGIVGYAAAFPYSDRCCYAGIAEFSVYVARSSRGRGLGRLAMQGLIQALRERGYHKLLSRVFPENVASLRMLGALGFREVGLHRRHGMLDGVWRDVVAVEYLIE